MRTAPLRCTSPDLARPRSLRHCIDTVQLQRHFPRAYGPPACVALDPVLTCRALRSSVGGCAPELYSVVRGDDLTAQDGSHLDQGEAQQVAATPTKWVMQAGLSRP